MEPNFDDDDGTFTRHARRHAREFSYQRFDKRPSISWWHRCMWILDFMTSARFGVIVALLVILGIHYKERVSTFVSSLTENGFRETLLDSFLSLCDLARTCYHVLCELTRRFLSPFHEETNSGPLFHTKSISHVSNGGQLPPLVVVAETNNAVDEGQAQNSTHGVVYGSSGVPSSDIFLPTDQLEDIQPAFINDEDYPKGWLTYHRILGVVSKEEADAFNQRHS